MGWKGGFPLLVRVGERDSGGVGVGLVGSRPTEGPELGNGVGGRCVGVCVAVGDIDNFVTVCSRSHSLSRSLSRASRLV